MEIPKDHPPQGVLHMPIGEPQGCAIMTWVGGIDILRHPPLKPSAATHPFPKARMVEADLGSGAEAQDYPCLSQDLFPLNLLFLKTLIK